MRTECVKRKAITLNQQKGNEKQEIPSFGRIDSKLAKYLRDCNPLATNSKPIDDTLRFLESAWQYLHAFLTDAAKYMVLGNICTHFGMKAVCWTEWLCNIE